MAENLYEYKPAPLSEYEQARQNMVKAMNGEYVPAQTSYNAMDGIKPTINATTTTQPAATKTVPSAFNYKTNPNAFNKVETGGSQWYNPLTWGDEAKVDYQLKPGYNPKTGEFSQSRLLDDKKIANMTAQENAWNAIANNQGMQWNDWANIGLGGLGTLMQLGTYGDRKDYLQGSVDALEQQMQNAEEAHNTKMKNTASYGSAFSNAG